MAQISERIFRDSLKDMDLWFLKLQNIHASTTPADYIVLGKERYLVEVKEISVYKGYTSFSFDRLTQEASLIYFESKSKHNHSYILFNFRAKTLKKSNVFLLKLSEYQELQRTIGKKSFNLNDILYRFKHRQLNILPGSKLDVSELV